jgi:hypothetical protein
VTLRMLWRREMALAFAQKLSALDPLGSCLFARTAPKMTIIGTLETSRDGI